MASALPPFLSEDAGHCAIGLRTRQEVQKMISVVTQAIGCDRNETELLSPRQIASSFLQDFALHGSVHSFISATILYPSVLWHGGSEGARPSLWGQHLASALCLASIHRLRHQASPPLDTVGGLRGCHRCLRLGV